MRILKFLSRFFICILCIGTLCTPSYAETNLPFGDVGDYGNWLIEDNMETIRNNISEDAEKFQENFQNEYRSPHFIPVEIKIGLMFVKALSAIDYVLQISLIDFTIKFLFTMYAFWIALEAYKMMRDSTDYKQVIYDVLKKGIIIAIWVMVLNYGPAKLFMILMTPILNLSTAFSDFILNSVAQTYNINIGGNTCEAIHDFVIENGTTLIADNGTVKLSLDSDTVASIMCLPGRLSTYFYHATGAAFGWFKWGFGLGHPTSAIIIGAVSIVIFVKCIFKYAFMTLGVVADLFLRLLMLPFTALAEALPSNSEKSYIGKIFNGFLSIFNTKKLSDVFYTFLNAAIYFISLAIVITICASLLSYIIPNDSGLYQYNTQSAMVTLLCGCLVLYLANKTDELAKRIGGSIDNSLGETLKNDAKTLWKDTKDLTGKIVKDWIKK